MPFLQRGELRIVAEATHEELEACRRLLPGIVDCCQLVTLPPMLRDQAVEALQKSAAIHQQNRHITIDPAAIPAVYLLFARFMPYLEFPGSAAEFVAEMFDRAARDKQWQIGVPEVLKLFIRRTGLPEWLLRNDQPLDAGDVLAAFRKQIIGQDAACRSAVDLITTFKAGLNDPARPLGVYLLTGPTGVGKTELAKTLARYLFGHGEREDQLVRLDMSEYSGPGAAERLLSTPAGEPSDFIKRIRQQPFCVLLFDEIEKAAPEVFDMLLGVLDEGRLTDIFGRVTNFHSAIILMTSNIGASGSAPFGLSRGAAPPYESEVTSFFRPEFVNRIDRVITFAPLEQDTVRTIVEKELRDLAAREGLAKRKLTITWTATLVDLIMLTGYDRRYGARPLQRVIEQQIVMPLAQYLIIHRTKPHTHITIDAADHRVLIGPS